MFRRFDVVEEASIDGRAPRRGDRCEQTRGRQRIGARKRRPPTLRPMIENLIGMIGRNPFEEGGLIEQRMSDAAVAPVEQRQRTAGAAKVTGMEVAVDQRIGYAAALERREASRQI